MSSDVRIDELLEAYNEAERYAGRMEAALEQIRAACKLLQPTGYKGDATLDLINHLATVKDDRKRIFTHAPPVAARYSRETEDRGYGPEHVIMVKAPNGQSKQG
jgi:hypothetical protein